MTRLDFKSIGEYSQAYSQQLCNEFFSNKDTISGSEILNISPVDQVNLFALKALFETWKTTSENFMNVTSQHIAVKKADFQAIIKKATVDTITLAISPADYFDVILRDLPDFKCTKSDIALMRKYTRINANIAEGISQKMGDENSVFTNQALNWLPEIIQEMPMDDADITLGQFNSTLDLDKSKFFKNQISANDTINKNENVSFFDNIAATKPTEIVEKPTVIAPKIEVEKAEVAVVDLPGDDAPETLNDQYQSAHRTVNEHLKADDNSQTLADLHQNSPIKNISGSISLNQKFIFINKLFNGDSAAYNETIDILEKCNSTDEAINLLKYKYAPKYQWNLNSDEADELMDILKRKS
jgi:hypothetical protein